MSVEGLKQIYIPQYLIAGKEKFYKLLLINALNKLIMINKGTFRGITPDIEYLLCYEQLIILYRREGEGGYLEMASVFRRLAHKIYRIMLKRGMTSYNSNFLNLV